MNPELLTIPAAYILDLIFGDPRWLPHPVKGIGWLAEKAEILLRKYVRKEWVAGVIFAITIVGFVWGLFFILIQWLDSFNRYWSLILSAILIYTSLAIKDLGVESIRVAEALKMGDTTLARKNLAMIVGRDTKDLSQREIIRATVETVSENIVDGIISPLFFAFLGGAPLCLAYKAVNTLDSMVGYKNDRYKEFGWASARLDDLANFIPARISAIIMPVAGWLAGKNGLDSFRITLRDGSKNPSPNSGLPEAAMAGALGIRLGGLNFYNSVRVRKPFIGEERNAPSIVHIRESVEIAYVSSGLFAIMGMFVISLI